MALKKAVEQETGYDATYWRIDYFSVDWRRKVSAMRIVGYKNESRRRSKPRNAIVAERAYKIRNKEFEKYFEVPDASDYPDWQKDTKYEKGDVVSYEAGLFQAKEKIVSNNATSPPDVSDKWKSYGNVRVNRKIAYQYIMKNDPDFAGATPV
jgi:hypothetical protein